MAAKNPTVDPAPAPAAPAPAAPAPAAPTPAAPAPAAAAPAAPAAAPEAPAAAPEAPAAAPEAPAAAPEAPAAAPEAPAAAPEAPAAAPEAPVVAPDAPAPAPDAPTAAPSAPATAPDAPVAPKVATAPQASAGPSNEDWVFSPPKPSLDIKELPKKVADFVEEFRNLCQPASVYVCVGSRIESEAILQHLVKLRIATPLQKQIHSFYVRTDPRDVAHVEGRTCISMPRKEDAVAPTRPGVAPLLGNWISPDELRKILAECFPGCMRGRTMFVLPFSMCPLDSPLCRLGVQVTDSPYVAACMHIITRMGKTALEATKNKDFVKCVHSMGVPLPAKDEVINHWPCSPENTIIAHVPNENQCISFGSGYGGNSILAKKCFALRIASVMGQKEGWLAEHMLILGITAPSGVKSYVVAAFPSACGKTNLAMITPTLPGYRAECVSDDIAWLYFDKDGVLRALNPEHGFFGVAPGTTMKTNPNAMMTIQTNTIFTNVAVTSEGGAWWEGMDMPPPDVSIASWMGDPHWTPGDPKKPAAQPNARFCVPAGQCPTIDPQWEDPKGVPVSAIIFGGRRPDGLPVVFEAFNWNHGVFIGASMRSECTNAAEFKGKVLMHDPFGMRPFFGNNFGDYLRNWIKMGQNKRHRLPRIFHVNWFRKGPDDRYLWPGFGENCRILDWMLRRIDGEVNIARKTIVGYVPTNDALNLKGLRHPVDMKRLTEVNKDFWRKESKDIRQFFQDHVGKSLPPEIMTELENLEQRVETFKDNSGWW
ncbi:phosphoenolpyruvate carboxykinase, cytosolic [GTP]-like [Ornithodoros turicata]|uniref:phosphoenolpyruvate carboxykinase, cytosolic [GTP]-like n=1 Tax=Ornithodoros turicata TaxID=34597 RepID=UPI003138BB32